MPLWGTTVNENPIYFSEQRCLLMIINARALEEISRNKGILYDSEVVDACLKVFRKKGVKFNP